MLNGQKTWIGLVVTFLPSFIADVMGIVNNGDDSFLKIVAILGKALVIVGAVHKLVKGEGVPPSA